MERVAGRYDATSICTNAFTSICPFAARRCAHLPRSSGGSSEGCGKLQSVHILPTAGFHISQPGGFETPPGGTHTCRKTVRDGQRGASGRGGGEPSGPRRFYTVRAVKLSRRVGIRGSFSCGRTWGNSGSGAFSSKRADGPQLPPLHAPLQPCYCLQLLQTLSLTDKCVSIRCCLHTCTLVYACLAALCNPLWATAALSHSSARWQVHSGERSRLPLRLWFHLSCFATFFLL